MGVGMVVVEAATVLVVVTVVTDREALN